METKEGLKPGMQVKNLVSGDIGKLVSHPGNAQEIYCTLSGYVKVIRQSPEGKWWSDLWDIKTIVPA